MIYPRYDRDQAEVADHYDELDNIYRRLWGSMSITASGEPATKRRMRR
jgi:hypothetical protein